MAGHKENDFTIVKSVENGWKSLYYEKRDTAIQDTYQICVDVNNNVWLTTSKGLELIKNGTRVVVTNNYNIYNPISHMVNDIYGNIWFGNNSEAFKYNHHKDSLQRYAIPNTSCMYADDLGNIWIGKNSREIIKIKNEVQTQYSLKAPISEDLMRYGSNSLKKIIKPMMEDIGFAQTMACI